MISPATIGIGILGAICAGLACWVAHRYAERNHWRFIHRCVYGVTVICAAFAAPLFAALSIETAGTLFLLLIIIAGAAGLGTWLNYQEEETRPTPASATPDADAFIERLEKELEQ